MEKFMIFEPLFNDEELENEFHKFFNANNLNKLFTNEHKTGHITVSYVDAKSIINEKGTYASILKDLSNKLSLANNNQKYNEATFKILHNASTFQKMMNNIKNILEEFYTTEDGYLHNFWNIVFYNKDLF